MGIRNKYIILLTLSALLKCTVLGLNWGGNCSVPCTCDLSYFSDLPITTRWLNQQPSETPRLDESAGNHATYSDDTPKGELMKTAMCMLQQGTELQALLAKLPEDIQVLTILQGRSLGELALEADYLQHFQDLTVLDIQGFPPDSGQPTDPLIMRNDALRPLANLQYLNLEHVKLMGHRGSSEASNNVKLPVATDNAKPSRKSKKDKHRLVFLKPEDNEIPLVSYSEYKQEIQREGLTTFAGLSNLLFLRVLACNLHEVAWEMFEGLSKLRYLSLERNELLFVPDFAFYGTPHLVTLSLAGNKLLSLEDTALAGLLELEKLDLSSNNFSHLSELSLPPFPKLRVADFRSNPVEAIFPSTFEIMNATHVLFLGGEGSPLNLLANSFLGLSSLTTLTVTNVKVPVMERQLLSGMSMLITLQMTGDIPIITFDAFLEVPRLEHLTLKHCNVTTISMDAFYGLRSLISLDLSSNSLAALPPGIFDQQASLRELLLQHNKLTELPGNLLAHLPAKMIRLDHNPWHCSCAMRDWQATTINKVKQRGVIPSATCQFNYDKGSMCQQTAQVERYAYDKRVEPRCTTPEKYKDWNVFHLLRKELQCTKYKKKIATGSSTPTVAEQEKVAHKLREGMNFNSTIHSSINKISNAQQGPKPEQLPVQLVLTKKDHESHMLSKKAREQLEIKKEIDEKALLKEIAKSDKLALTKKGNIPDTPKKVGQQLEVEKEIKEKTIIKEITGADIGTTTIKSTEPNTLSKKPRQQLELKKETDVKTGIEDIPTVNKDLFTKKAWKLDMAKKRQEKLKQLHSS